MNTRALENFAQSARRQLREQVAARLAQVLGTDSVEIREQAKAVEALQAEIKRTARGEVIERVAYTWFNRFCALRFMDANHYTRIGIVSPVAGFTQPEILQEAKQGLIDDSFPVDKQRIMALLGGQTPAAHPQGEAYRLLLVGACNATHKLMPFLFEPIEDYTELLLPTDLLSEQSILHAIREALTPDICRDVEVIGWLYQFYISERKDEVFAGLKKGKKIQAQDIPAATQLFTPHWIVRYLVENSLGRLWLLNRPHSRLAEVMDYYIADSSEQIAVSSEQAASGEQAGNSKQIADSSLPATGYRLPANRYPLSAISSPEEIKICDPACGSGHMLTYAFDLLTRIYEEEGYDPVQIPRLILEKNLYGIEIDQRAGDLAALALTMKARAKDRRFFRRAVTPNICILENVHFTETEINDYMDAVGRDLFTADFEATLTQFEQVDNVGSLIRPQVKDIETIRERLADKGIFENLFLHTTHRKVQQVLTQAEYLSQRYHVVVANPPYMGKGMNTKVKSLLKKDYTDVSSDLFSAFIVRIMGMVKQGGFIGMMTPVSWMFLSSFEKLRHIILDNNTIICLVRPEYHALFDSAFVTICGFVLSTIPSPDAKGAYIDLTEFYGADIQPIKTLEAINNRECGWFYQASTNNFEKIPGSPISYWASDRVRSIFDNPPLESITISDGQNVTGNNDRFVRKFWEVNIEDIGISKKWFFYAKGGEFRRWHGNIIDVIDWSVEARTHYKKDRISRIIPEYLWYERGITWGLITSSNPSFRILPREATFDKGGSSVFFQEEKEIEYTLGCLNSNLTTSLLKLTNPTVNYQVKNIRDLPILSIENKSLIEKRVNEALILSQQDWDSYETSPNLSELPLLSVSHHTNLKQSYANLRQNWQKTTQEMRHLEEDNNRIFIDAYGLQDELTPEVPLSEITLTCNPHYRYGGKKSEKQLEALLLADTTRELVSYAVGCMFGRYSLDRPGLILANQGDTAAAYRAHIPTPSFPPDEDNVIPILDEGWFSDDIAERFKAFLRLTFGEAHYAGNLAFLENALGRDIRSYFLRDFYDDHLKTYKKRPIYWLFSSPNGSFNALIYMHRYRPDTLSVILNDYLRQYRDKLSAHQAHLEQVSLSGSQREKTQALKEIDRLNKILAELKEYEDEILYPLATERVEIDLDDGVKVNYGKFGRALRKVSGLS